jgi:hypothetical protein
MKESGEIREISSNALEREFSSENLRAYAGACEEIGVRLAEILEKKEDGVAILLPSRGAIPVFIGACFSLESLGMLDLIDLPPLTCFDYIRIRRKAALGGETQSQRTPVLIFPFTADVNFGDLVREPEQQREIIEHMRRFGARAVMDFFKSPGERNGLEYRLFLAFLEVVERRRRMIEFYEEFPQVEKLVVIDTVISGRASWTILNEWEKNGKNIKAIEGGGEIEPILVVDAMGRKVKEEFGKYIHSCGSCHYIPRILTEDRGAALEGVAAVVYPQLILAAHEKSDLYPQGYPLFGSWHSVPSRVREVYLEIFNGFLATIEGILEGKDFKGLRENFLQQISEAQVLSGRNSVNGEDLNPHHQITKVQETSAHVVQIYYSPQVVSDIIREITKRLRESD